MGPFLGFILILLGFGFLIFIHELGHFLAAKWAGVRADGFAIGMGPCVASYRRGVGLVLGSADARVVRREGRRPIEMSEEELRRHGFGETEYSLRALPLGGFVRMLGQEDGRPDATSSDHRSFGQAPIGRRAVIILAGIAANLALAIVLFLVAFLVGVRFPAPLVGFVVPDGAAASARPAPSDAPAVLAGPGLRTGDRIRSIDGDETRTFVDVRVAAAMARPGRPLELEVERDGKTMRFLAEPERDPTSGLLAIGIDVARTTELSGSSELRAEFDEAIGAVAPEVLAAGIEPGSRIVRVAGQSVSDYAGIDRVVRGSGGGSIEIEWENPAVDGGARDRRMARVELQPTFESVPPASGSGPAEPTLAGLAPLARVVGVVDGSLNLDVILPGDVFLRVGSADGPRQSQLIDLFRAAPGETIPAIILRDGARTRVELRTNREGQIGVRLAPAWDLPILADPIERAGGETSRALPAAGLDALPLATVLSIDGTPVPDLRDLRRELVAKALAAPPGAPLAVDIGMRDPSPESVAVTMPLSLAPADVDVLRGLGEEFPMPDYWFEPEKTILTADGNPIAAIGMGFRQTVVMIEQVFLTLDRVGRGSVGVEQLQGPVGILHTGTRVAGEGFTYMLFFLAMISVNLAVVNALPIPIADGGLFLFLVYEKVFGRPPSLAFQNAAAMAGIMLVAGLFLLTFYNDLGRIFG